MPSRQQLKQLQLALINAFPSRALLERLLYFELEKNLNEITRDSDLQEIIFKLIQTAEAQGWLEDLVRAAYNENPGNPLLKPIAQELLTGGTDQTPLPNIPEEPSNQEQEKILLLAELPRETAVTGSCKRDSFEKKINTNDEEPDYTALKESIQQKNFSLLQAFIIAIELVDEEIAPKLSRPQTLAEAREELERAGTISSSIHYSANHNLISSIKNLGNDIIQAKKFNLDGDIAEIYEVLQGKINQWTRILAQQAGFSEQTIISKVSIKKQQLLNQKQGLGFLFRNLRQLFIAILGY